jgi:DNA processing protein
MTLIDAAGLAILALHDRRLVAAVLRAVAGRSTAEEAEALPPRLPGEPVLDWACRARAAADADSTRLRTEAERQIARATESGIHAIAIGDERYPPLLAVIPDPPPVLWAKGETAALRHRAVGVVGSRAATPYGLDMSRRVALDLARAGVAVVSGLARGIDAAAHRAALDAQGVTIGVLGCGIDRVYPAEHAALAREMARTGVVMSEFPPGVPPLPHHFPMRNRIIITASAAAEQGRDVMVIPGPITGGRNRGGHLLIRDGAKLVESVQDVLEELDITAQVADNGPSVGIAEGPNGFTVDEISARTGELPNLVLARLLELELAGKIQRIGGGRFVRVLT